MPVYPATLKLTGVTKGRVVVAVSVDAEGRVKDQLVVAYTDPHFVRTTTDVLNEWRFAPARLDGEPVPVQFDLSFEYTLEGAVITAGIAEHFLYDTFTRAGNEALSYRPVKAVEIDRAPVRVDGKSPKYALAAAKDGVRGTVMVRFYIDEKGNVRLPSVANEGNIYLSEQAVTAVKDWKFEPVTRGGRPVLVAAQQEFNFGGGK